MWVFYVLKARIDELYDAFYWLTLEFVNLGHKVIDYPVIGPILAIGFYAMYDWVNWITLQLSHLKNLMVDAEEFCESWQDGSMIEYLIHEAVTLVVDQQGKVSEWLKQEVNKLDGRLYLSLFTEDNDYGWSFAYQIYYIGRFFVNPGMGILRYLGFCDTEWSRLFIDPLGWLLDRLTELGFILPAWLEDPETWLWNWLVEWNVFDGVLPDDILAWLWEWLLSTASDTFERIAAPFQILASKMLRYLIEGVFET